MLSPRRRTFVSLLASLRPPCAHTSQSNSTGLVPIPACRFPLNGVFLPYARTSTVQSSVGRRLLIHLVNPAEKASGLRHRAWPVNLQPGEAAPLSVAE